VCWKGRRRRVRWKLEGTRELRREEGMDTHDSRGGAVKKQR
jgi:hypothetical protein